MTSWTRPRVTVSIPTRNRAAFLREALSSVLDQTFTDIEVIVSDNASTDDTKRVVTSFNDPRVCYSPLPENIGLHGNLSRCLHLGTAPYVSILPDDDFMLPRNLERKVEVLDRNEDVGIVHSAFHLLAVLPDGRQVLKENVNQTRSNIDRIEPGQAAIRRLLADSYFINFPGAVMRRSVIDSESFDEMDGPAADLGLCLRLASKSAVGFVAEPLVVWRLHPGSGNVQDGIHEFDGREYRPSLASVALTKIPKERFLTRHAHELPDLRVLRVATRTYSRSALRYAIQIKSRPDRTIREGIDTMRAAVHIDKTVLLRAYGIRFLASSLLGARVRLALSGLHERRKTTQ